MKKYGFTIIELMIVVAIIAFLAMVAVPNFKKFLAKSKRSEVYINLGAIYAAEKAYFAEHGKYSANLTGPEGIGFKPDGQTVYTYGFGGTEGVNFIKGKLASADNISQYAKVGPDSFTAVAIADIDGDSKPDVITINEKREIKIEKDDIDD